MTAIPAEGDLFTPASKPDIVVETGKKENLIKKHTLERQRKIMSVVLKLAQHGSYDADGVLIRTDGSRVEESDLIELLLFAMSRGRLIRGLDDFARILAKAGVTPDEVINSQVRDLLMKQINQHTNVPSTAPPPQDPPSPHTPPIPPPRDHDYHASEDTPMNEELVGNKRKRDEGHEEPDTRVKASKKLGPWDLSDDDSMGFV